MLVAKEMRTWPSMPKAEPGTTATPRLTQQQGGKLHRVPHLAPEIAGNVGEGVEGPSRIGAAQAGHAVEPFHHVAAPALILCNHL